MLGQKPPTNLTVVERDYTKLYDKFITLGDRIRSTGLGAHGNSYQCVEEYDEMITSNHFPVERQNGNVYPSPEGGTSRPPMLYCTCHR